MTKQDIENLQTEGMSGVEDLAKLARALGYKDRSYMGQLNNGCFVGDIVEMLEDNPGMLEAIYNFVLDNIHNYRMLDLGNTYDVDGG